MRRFCQKFAFYRNYEGLVIYWVGKQLLTLLLDRIEIDGLTLNTI